MENKTYLFYSLLAQKLAELKYPNNLMLRHYAQAIFEKEFEAYDLINIQICIPDFNQKMSKFKENFLIWNKKKLI